MNFKQTDVSHFDTGHVVLRSRHMSHIYKFKKYAVQNQSILDLIM